MKLLAFGMAFWVDSGVRGMKGTTLLAPCFQVTTGDKRETSRPRTSLTKSVLREGEDLTENGRGRAGEAGGSPRAGSGESTGLGGTEDRGDSGAGARGGELLL